MTVSALDELFGPLSDEPDAPPIPHISPSFLERMLVCPEQVRREKILKEVRPTNTNLVFGTSLHRALEHNWLRKIDGNGSIGLKEMRDLAGDSFNETVEKEKNRNGIDWGTDKPHVVQEDVIVALVGKGDDPGYMQTLEPTVDPVACERWIRIEDTPVGYPLIGRIDVETADGWVLDLKTSSKRKTQTDIDKSIQGSAYVWARGQEDAPAAGFAYHVLVKNKTPVQQELRTRRTARDMESFERIMVRAVDTLHYCMEHYGPDEPWPGASMTDFLCSPRMCSFWGNGCVWRPA